MSPAPSINRLISIPRPAPLLILASIFIIICSAAAGCASVPAPRPTRSSRLLQRYDYSRISMGVEAKIVFDADSADHARAAAQAAFHRLDDLDQIMSDYQPDSELMRMCDKSSTQPGTPIPVSDDLWRVLSQSQEISEASDGAFDITVGPIVQLWRTARKTHEMPGTDAVAKSRALVGYRMVHLINGENGHHAVALDKAGMRLDLGGIGKGFAAQEVADLLKEQFHITSCMIDMGGDLVLGDAPPDSPKGWPVAIRTQSETTDDEILSLHNTAIATSGDLEQFVEFGGIRYSHIVDPKTGLGLTTRTAVTAIAPDGGEADALATAVSVLGPEKGVAMLLKRFPKSGYSVRIVTLRKDANGRIIRPEQPMVYESPTFPDVESP